MHRNIQALWFRCALYPALICPALTRFSRCASTVNTAVYAAREEASIARAVPSPLLDKGHPVEWWFVFKFNS